MLRKMASGSTIAKKMYHCIFFLLFRLRSNLKNSCFEFHQGFFEHLETIKPRGRRPSAFIYFSVFGTPDETLALVFDILHEFTQGRLNLNNDWDIPFTSPYSISHERQGGGTRAEDKWFLFSEISKWFSQLLFPKRGCLRSTGNKAADRYYSGPLRKQFPTMLRIETHQPWRWFACPAHIFLAVSNCV